jgi:hypothetical protein
MTTWTPAADAALGEYINQHRARLLAAGADPADVLDDLRGHITEEATRAGIAMLTRDDVLRMLAGMQNEPLSASPPDPTSPTGLSAPRLCMLALIFCLAFGVALPIIAWVFELLTGICTSELFDPLPTAWHVALVALVPLANLLGCINLRRAQLHWLRLLDWSNSIALGIALYYALGFLPFTPFAVVGIVVMGLGFLPLAPLCAFITGLALRRHLRARAAESGARLRRTWCGLLIGLLALLALDVPKAVTLAGMQMAVNENDATQARGVQLLRAVGDDVFILRACYVQRRFAIDLLTMLFRVIGPEITRENAQAIYYRVTGVPYNAVPPPAISGPRTRMANVEQFDFDQGGEAVAARLRGLSLDQSRLDGTLGPDAATAYLEWTMVFRNNSMRQHEARANVVLPPGAVISRVTLWVNDVPREAAFAPRAQARQAYEDIVQQQRDPILVTTSGRDQVLVQCFPVPPDNGTMKVRIGMTVPLTLPDLSDGLLRLPYFSERNFSLRAGLTHDVWLEAPTALRMLQTAPQVVCTRRDAAFVARGDMGADAVDQIRTIGAPRDAHCTNAWVWLDTSSNRVVRQNLVSTTAVPPQRVVFVVDQSRRMRAYTNVLLQAFAAMPAGLEVAILAAGDTVQELLPPTVWSADARAQAVRAVTRREYAGGCDNTRALTRAWDLAADRAPGIVLWLHATQPVRSRAIEALWQRLARQPWSPTLLDLQCGTGPNAVLEQLNGLAAVQRAARFGTPAQDLARVVAQWQPGATLVQALRWCEPPGLVSSGTPADAHLARLWAKEQITTWCGERRATATSNAVALATTQHLVTPVSGAVVLETDAQFRAAGLTPVSDELVPRVVPEPGVSSLLLLGSIVLLRRRLRKAV